MSTRAEAADRRHDKERLHGGASSTLKKTLRRLRIIAGEREGPDVGDHREKRIVRVDGETRVLHPTKGYRPFT
jgi:hypothetical protein